MLKVYGFPLSPFVRKALAVMRGKRVAYQRLPASPRDPSGGFAPAGPFRKMPAIAGGDFTLAREHAVADGFG